MSIEHDVTYKWAVPGGPAITVARQIVGAVAGALDTQVPAGAVNSTAAFALTPAKVLSVFLTSDQPVTLKAGGVNASQAVAVTGTPTGGSFTLTVGAQTTAAIAYNATAAQVSAALDLLSGVGANGVTATGGPLPGTPVSVTFVGLLGLQPVTTMTHTDSFTGGSSPAAAVTSVTTGVVADTTISLVAGVPLVWDSAAYFAQPFASNVTTLALTNTAAAGANVRLRTLSNA